MRTVDEIIASGRYKSRAWGLIERCREACSGNGLWVCAGHFEPWEHLTTEQVAKAIERDQHRDECPGLKICYRHPVPHVVTCSVDTGFRGSFSVYGLPGGQAQPDQDSLPEAMDAARALVVAP